MTRFKKHVDVQSTLMVKKTIIRKPSGEIVVDPHKAKYLNDAWMKKIRKPNGDINYDFYTPLLTPYTSKIVVQYLLDMKIGLLGVNQNRPIVKALNQLLITSLKLLEM